MGSATKSRNLCEATFQSSVNDAQIKQTISKGQGMMPAFGDDYDEAQLSALVRYLRSLKKAPP